ncbi:Gfo/Idh/MocA family oxidoreductase [soil metagenome]
MTGKQITRRGFVGAVGTVAGAATLGVGVRASASASASAVSPQERVRLGLIGAGSRGNQLLTDFLRREEVEFVAVADVDDNHAGQTAERIAKEKGGQRPDTMRDYRQMLDRDELDAVVIGTPDHWHAHPTIHACQAGKDVYVEKPLAHNVAEGRAMVNAARKYGRVVQVGTQQRSSENFRKAAEAVRSGKIGKVHWVQTWNFENISPLGMGPVENTEPPPHVDYDMWLGPAAKVPFNVHRFHLLFRWYFDYAGGMMSDWGVHLNDIVLWALDVKGPSAVATTGGIWTVKDDRDTPDTMQVVYQFPDDCVLTYSMRKGNGYPLDGKGYGIQFHGTDGTLFLDRAGHRIIPDRLAEPYGIQSVKGKMETRTIDLEPESFEAQGDGTPEHIADFLNCVKTRETPICDVERIHHSTNTTHLGNISYLLGGRKLVWDVESETFPNDPQANRLLTREYRQGYELPAI